MNAILCTEYAEDPQLAFGDLPALKPGPREIVVDVQVAAVSFMDVLMTQGRYQMKPPLPYVPGTDAAGLVSAIGAEVSRVGVGDRVACSHWHGTWAEQRTVREDG